MSTQPLMLNVPEPLYDHLKERAEQAQRSVEEETLEVLSTVIPADAALPAEFAEAVESLKTADESALWETAKSHLAEDVSEQLEALHVKRQREGLSEAESTTLCELVRQYERQMLVRAAAAVELKERGHDISELAKP